VPESPNDKTQGLFWHISEHLCALRDNERHLGHLTKTGNHWEAYDSTHLNPEGNGFRFLGTFTSIDIAKTAVEEATSVTSKPAERTLQAGS
jgi:hypothetical protein